LSCFVPAALVPIAALLITNGQATGGLLPFYSFYGTEKYVYTHNGVPSYWSDPKGIDRATDSFLTYLLHCTVGHHGLASLSPILLLTGLGWGLGLRRDAKLRDYLALGLGLTLLVLAYYLTRTANYNYGGKSVALRWMLWLVPLWILGMLPAVERLSDRRWFRWVAAALLAPSIFSAWHPIGSPWNHPWLFQWLSERKWIDYSDPPPTFPRAVHCWLYELPAGPRVPEYWVELASVDADGQKTRLRIEDGGPALVSQRVARVVRFQMSGTQSFQLTLTFDVEAFRAGEPLTKSLLWPQGLPAPDAWRRAVSLLTGLPLPDGVAAYPFQPTQRLEGAAPVRREHLDCTLAFTRAVLPPPGAGGEQRLYESRIVVSSEMPFGIVRLETFVYDASGRTQHAHRRWIAERAGMFLPRPTPPQPAGAAGVAPQPPAGQQPAAAPVPAALPAPNGAPAPNGLLAPNGLPAPPAAPPPPPPTGFIPYPGYYPVR